MEDPKERVVSPRLFPSTRDEDKPAVSTGHGTALTGIMDWDMLLVTVDMKVL